MPITMFAADDSELAALQATGGLDPTTAGLPAVRVGSFSPYGLVTLDSAVTGEPADAVAAARAAGARWAATEEMAADGANPEECGRTVAELAHLAGDARAASRTLYTWLVV